MELTFQDISYSKVGTGPHLCFLHGFCENSTIWDRLINLLKADYTCIAIDIPGFGKSNYLSMPSIPEIARQINALLLQEGIHSCKLFGHSMGGYIAAEYLSLYPDQLSGIGFVHSTLRSDSPTKKENRLKTISFIQRHGSEDFFKIFVPNLVASHNLPELKNELTNLVDSTFDQSIIDGLNAMMNRKDKTSHLKSFKEPVLFLIGELDEHYPKSEIFNQASMAQIAQVSVLKDTGHLSMYENEIECGRHISRFLAFAETFN